MNGGGVSLSTGALTRIHSFDDSEGIVEAEAGVTLGQLINRVAPSWIVPSCPGTQAVTIGGMVAHDVHGKNHAHAGTIGEHVLDLKLHRSDRGRLHCSTSENPALFRATIGGLGLTGLIERVRLRLTPLRGQLAKVERIRSTSLAEVFELLRDTESYDYGLAWVDSFSLDCAAPEGGYPRCVVLRATVLPGTETPPARSSLFARGAGALGKITPSVLFRRSTMRLVNRAYYAGPRPWSSARSESIVPLKSFLFPQDDAHASNRLYGRRGVFAHHSLLPEGDDAAAIELLRCASQPGKQSLVTVLKAFGSASRPSSTGGPGLLSFTGQGLSTAVGFPNEGAPTAQVLERLDAVTLNAGGKLYPAKDARMPASAFARSYSNVALFADQLDPAMGSNFWSRVRGSLAQ